MTWDKKLIMIRLCQLYDLNKLISKFKLHKVFIPNYIKTKQEQK